MTTGTLPYLTSLQDKILSQVIEQKENLMREVLQSYLKRDITNEDWLKFKIRYSLNSEEIFYDEVLLGTTETYFGSDEKDFLRNEYKVICRFTPNPAPLKFTIVT